MKDFGKTVDRIIKIEPNLDIRLTPIKIKWEKYPKKATTYWEQLLKVLNTEVGPQHPKRAEIQGILSFKRKPTKKIYSFEFPTESETVQGFIPEHLEYRLKKYDRMQIDLAKMGIEARLTHNRDLAIKLARQSEFLEANQKKLWVEIKDYFKLWAVEGPITFFIRLHKDGCLVLTSISTMQRGPQGMQGQDNGDSFLMRLDPDVLKKFFRFLNIQPPPGLLPE